MRVSVTQVARFKKYANDVIAEIFFKARSEKDFSLHIAIDKLLKEYFSGLEVIPEVGSVITPFKIVEEVFGVTLVGIPDILFVDEGKNYCVGEFKASSLVNSLEAIRQTAIYAWLLSRRYSVVPYIYTINYIPIKIVSPTETMHKLEIRKSDIKFDEVEKEVSEVICQLKEIEKQLLNSQH